MSIKTSFTIKDLENLSGIKAHTIRIWEKRYNLLQPERTDSNIRTYNLDSLQKILSISIINNQGVKVSKIACLNRQDINDKILEITAVSKSIEPHVNELKMAMLKFDQNRFNETYKKLAADYSIVEIFSKVFFPLLENIGLLWISSTITPAHEHFITNLVKQKLLIAIGQLTENIPPNDKTFVLFLPLNEIHDIGLLLVHHELLSRGYKSIYLGQSIPIENLILMQNVFDKITYVSYFTVSPTEICLQDYFNKVHETVLKPKKEKLHLLGRKIKDCTASIPSSITVHTDALEMIKLWS
ncbi:MAG: DNA-binding transcriptional MerR regulator [Patiriisocius sp.]